MDLSGGRFARGLFIAFVVAVAAVIAWFLLTFLFKFVPRLAAPLLLLTALFLIVLILIQRGKGGGLAGAFGGLGGQSAFGTKAGDLFTRVTMGVALFWIILCMSTVSVLGTAQNIVGPMGGSNPVKQAAPPSPSDQQTSRGPQQTPAGGTGASGTKDGSS
jgi:preprotein translocase subunit SecG